MSILIEGMEMPKNCGWCPLRGSCVHRIYMECRPTDCPLIEVHEPHGRLGDLDALPWYLANTSVKYATYEDWEMLCDAIAAAPTVIPASGEEIDEAQRDYETAADYQQYCETYEQTYDPDTGAM